ncbi:hypothetical protein ABW21_db0203415 [Orbilia brochopaga]|nr:hypothetical protein ABW21_db0203415 [Drechslerella brochopaga]
MPPKRKRGRPPAAKKPLEVPAQEFLGSLDNASIATNFIQKIVPSPSGHSKRTAAASYSRPQRGAQASPAAAANDTTGTTVAQKTVNGVALTRFTHLGENINFNVRRLRTLDRLQSTGEFQPLFEQWAMQESQKLLAFWEQRLSELLKYSQDSNFDDVEAPSWALDPDMELIFDSGPLPEPIDRDSLVRQKAKDFLMDTADLMKLPYYRAEPEFIHGIWRIEVFFRFPEYFC